MHRLVFNMEPSGSISTDVLSGMENPFDTTFIDQAVDDLIPRVAKTAKDRQVIQVVFKEYRPEYKLAFVERELEMDLTSINQRIQEVIPAS